MNSSDSQPKIPFWIFAATYLVLIGAATLLYQRGGNPLSPGSALAIMACVVAGALVVLVPCIMHIERQKNEALDDRQRALEALARTISSSAEQISIAANGLHEIAELAQKNLRHAEQLPHKLQDKIAEFQAQLAAAEDEEKEELQRELLSLRTTESERLESVSQRIAKSSAEWSKLEAATQQHLAAATEALAKLSLGTAAAIGKAQAAAEQALGQARVEAARTIGEAAGQATRTIDTAKQSALSDLDGRIALATSAAIERIVQQLDAKVADLAAAVQKIAATPRVEVRSTTAEPMAAPIPVADDPFASPSAEMVASTPTKRPRKPRASGDAPATSTELPAPSPASPESKDAAAAPDSPADGPSSPTPATPSAPIEEPAPIANAPVAAVNPIDPPAPEPLSAHAANGAESHAAPPTHEPPVSAEAPKASRKRAAAKKPEPGPEPLGFELDDSPVSTATAAAESVITSDGATRLLVTAYIGIGNRLFIRGEGPGLSWEKGVPLQFVSIGKWRWETNDASAPVNFKLYKNDDLECSALGTQTLEPGHQQELTAAF